MSLARHAAVAAAVLALGALGLTAAAQTQAPILGGLDARDGSKTVSIEAEQGVEWRQNNRVYIARGHAKATRGEDTVYADTLYAYYRPATPAKGASGTSTASASFSNGSTEIYRLEADGDVRFVTPTQTAYGDHAVYDVDQAILVLTGTHLRLVTPRDTVTARDSIEWYDHKQMGVARGDALAVRDQQRRIRADVLTAFLEKPADQPSHVSRIDANGGVLVSSLDQIARGDAGVYNVDTGMATLSGHVTLTKGQDELRGRYAVVDLNNNVSRLLSAPPDEKVTARKPTRVEGLLVPRPKPDAPAR